MDFLVVGDIMVDQTIYGEVNKISPEAPVPVIECKRETKVLGGAGNVAMNLVGLGHNVYLCGHLGPLAADICGKHLKINTEFVNLVNKDNVKLRYVDEKTGYHLIRVDNEDEVKSYGPFESSLTKSATNEAKIDGIIISDYNKGTLDSENISDIILAANAGKKKIPVFVDTRRADASPFYRATWMMPNLKELHAMIKWFKDHHQKDVDTKELVKQIGGDGFVVTKSEDGMELFERNGNNVSIPADAKDVVDVTGAGDTSMAAFAVAICEGHQPTEAMGFANWCAGIVCKYRGTTAINIEQAASYYRLKYGIYR